MYQYYYKIKTISLGSLICRTLLMLNQIAFTSQSEKRTLCRRQFGGGLATMGGAGKASGGCTAYEIISARGTGERQNNPTGSAGFIKGVMSAVAGGSVYEVRYPASMDYMNGPGKGARDAWAHVSPKLTRCPNQVYVFFGYSEGAMVVTQFFAKSQKPINTVAAIVLYGNPHYTPGAPQNVCSGKTGRGVAGAMGLRLPPQYAKVTFDCCLAGDMVCQTMGTMVPHLAYPRSPSEKNAITFTVQKLRAKLAASRGGGSGTAKDSSGKTLASADAENSARSGKGAGVGLGGGMGGLGGGASSLLGKMGGGGMLSGKLMR